MIPGDYLTEDFSASGHSRYTIDNIDKKDSNWLDQAAAQVNAAYGDDYVKLESGLLTVNQIEILLNAMQAEFNFVDDNNQFLAFNHLNPVKTLMTERRVSMLGEPLADCFNGNVPSAPKIIIHLLRQKKQDLVRIPVPKEGFVFPVHYFLPLLDENNNYQGTTEWALDIWPFVNYYLKTNGLKLVTDVDAHTSASEKLSANKASELQRVTALNQPDVTSGASKK